MLNVTFAPVVVAVEELYDHSNGNYEIAYLWNGVQVTTAGGMYSRETFTVNATADQIAAAAQWTKVNTEYKPTYSKHINGGRGGFTYVGCVVTLARSRKAPNKNLCLSVALKKAILMKNSAVRLLIKLLCLMTKLKQNTPSQRPVSRM